MGGTEGTSQQYNRNHAATFNMMKPWKGTSAELNDEEGEDGSESSAAVDITSLTS